MRIYIIGFMGCGKSTLGKKLAKVMDMPLYDLDKEIEKSEGMSIPEIFESHGESYFRESEKNNLKKISDEDAIISCGGGAPCFFDNMDWMNNNGFTLFLNLPVGALANRLENSKHKRPLLENLDIPLEDYIAEKLAERAEHYQKAKMIVNGLGLDVNHLAEVLKEI